MHFHQKKNRYTSRPNEINEELISRAGVRGILNIINTGDKFFRYDIASISNSAMMLVTRYFLARKISYLPRVVLSS